MMSEDPLAKWRKDKEQARQRAASASAGRAGADDDEDASDSDDEESIGVTSLAPLRTTTVVFGTGAGGLALFDLRTMEVVANGFKVDATNKAHSGGTLAVATLGDDNYIASGGHCGDLSVWDIRTGGRVLWEKPHVAPVTSVTSLGGQTVLTTSLDCSGKIIDLSTMEEQSLRGVHGLGLDAGARVQTSESEQIIVTGSRDADPGTNLALLSGQMDVDGDQRLFGYLSGHTGPVKSLACFPHHQVLSGGGLGCGRVMLWSLGLCAEADEEELEARSQSKTGTAWRCFDAHELGRHRGSVVGLTAVSDGAACSASSDGTLRLWRLEGRCCAGTLVDSSAKRTPSSSSSLSSSSDGFRAVCATYDGSCVISGSAGGKLVQWDLRTGKISGDAHATTAGDSSLHPGSSSTSRSTTIGSVLRSDGFLKHLGGDVYLRSLASLRKTLKDVPIDGLEDLTPETTVDTQRGAAAIRQRPHQEEVEKVQPPPLQHRRGSSVSSAPSTGAGGRGTGNPWWWRREGQRQPPPPSGYQKGRPWRNTKRVTLDRIARPPNPMPSILHEGGRYDLARARPKTGSRVVGVGVAPASNGH